MLLLAIDTSGKQGSIALARVEEDDAPRDVEIIEVMPLLGGTFSAQLIPQISTLISTNGYTKDAIGGLSVVSGPGSFTGLRVGLAAVKALAEVLGRPIAAVSLLEVIAFASGAQGRVMAVTDAGRGDLYAGVYDVPATAGAEPREYILSRAEFLSQAKGRIIVTADRAIAEIAAAAGLSASTLPPVSAAEVARLGWQKIQSGETVTPEQLEANYIRRTDAEILRQARS
jgi:tRNA threonylcarbamoyladenosine biosynthesis protein TsaB